MNKKAIMAGLLLTIGSLAFSANPTDPEILKIPTLKTLSEKVSAQEQKVKATATSSRAAGAEAQANLTAAYNEYVTELKKQKETAASATLKTAIDAELKAVNEKMTPSPAKSR